MSDRSDTETHEARFNDLWQRLYTRVPQDRSNQVGKVQANLRVTEIVVALVLAALVFIIPIQLGWRFSFIQVFAACLAFVGPLALVGLSPEHVTPEEWISRNVLYFSRRIRQPLCSEVAYDIPGVVDIHATTIDGRSSEGDNNDVGAEASKEDASIAGSDGSGPELAAVEQDDGAIAVYLDADPRDASQDDPVEWAEDTKDLSDELNRSLGRTDQVGFKSYMKLRRTPPTPYRQVEDLEHAARGDAVPRSGSASASMPDRASRSAAERSEYLLDWTADTNVMESDLKWAIPVYPDEAERTNPIRDILVRHCSFIRPTESQRDAQIQLAKRRAIAQYSALKAIGEVSFVDRDGVAAMFRSFWLDIDRPDGEGWQWSAQTATGARLPRSEVGHSPAVPDDVPNSTRLDRRKRDGTVRGALADLRTNVATSVSDTSRLKSLIAPAYVKESPKHVELNERYAETVWINSLPLTIQLAQLSSIETVPGVEYHLSAEFDTEDYEDKLKAMKRRRKIIGVYADIKRKFFQAVDRHGPVGDGSAGNYDDLTEEEDELGGQYADLRDAMKHRDQEAFSVSVAITIRADTKNELRDARQLIEDRLSGDDTSVAQATKHQLPGLVSCSPSTKNPLKDAMQTDITFDMTTDALACFVPRHGFIRQDDGGVVLGMAKTAPSDKGDALGLLQVDFRSLSTGHVFVVGDSGDGKTAGTKQDALEEIPRHHLEQNDRQALNTIIFDITQQYDSLVEAFGGTKIELGVTKLNPFEIRPPQQGGFRSASAHLADRKRLITMMIEVVLRENADESDFKRLRSTLSVAVSKTFDRLGFTEAAIADDPSVLARRSPVMQDFNETLTILHESPGDLLDDGSAAVREGTSEDAKALLNRLKELWKGNDYDFFWIEPEHADDPEYTANIYNQVVYFDAWRYKNSNSSTLEMMVLYLMSHGQELSNFSGRETRVICDETHKLFQNVSVANRLQEFVRSGRNDGQHYTLISQTDEDFNEDAALVMARQCPTTLWYSLGAGADLDTAKKFGWEHSQAELFDALVRGDDDNSNYAECLVKIDGDVSLVERRMDAYNFQLISYREHEHGPIEDYMHHFDHQPAPDTLAAGPVVDDYYATLTGARGHGGQPESDSEPSDPKPAVADGGEDR